MNWKSLRHYHRCKRREEQVICELPDALLLFATVLRAGLDFQTALCYYVRWGPPGLLRQELERVLADLSVGTSRVQALGKLSSRFSSTAFSDTLSIIQQGLRLGSPLSPLLFSQAQQLRQMHFYRLEAKAAQAPFKMLIPLFLFIFPAILLILFGPLWLSFQQGGLNA